MINNINNGVRNDKKKMLTASSLISPRGNKLRMQ